MYSCHNRPRLSRRQRSRPTTNARPFAVSMERRRDVLGRLRPLANPSSVLEHVLKRICLISARSSVLVARAWLANHPQGLSRLDIANRYLPDYSRFVSHGPFPVSDNKLSK